MDGATLPPAGVELLCFLLSANQRVTRSGSCASANPRLSRHGCSPRLHSRIAHTAALHCLRCGQAVFGVDSLLRGHLLWTLPRHPTPPTIHPGIHRIRSSPLESVPARQNGTWLALSGDQGQPRLPASHRGGTHGIRNAYSRHTHCCHAGARSQAHLVIQGH